MKRVNLTQYFNLAEMLSTAQRATTAKSNKGGSVYFGISGLPETLREFIKDDNGFSASKHVARELVSTIDNWIDQNLFTSDSPPTFDTEKFDVDFHSWDYGTIASKIEAFKSVFEAECRDVDVYSVGQISIYKTSALVSNGAAAVPEEIRTNLPSESLEEFNNAGKCLAFDLPTACGFHALRGLELVMDSYLQSFGVVTDDLNSWYDYIKAAEKLSEADNDARKPSPKVTAMLDRMRELDRNPLMHPRDTLDDVQADMLFRLCTITVVEMARDMTAVASAPSEKPKGANDTAAA